MNTATWFSRHRLLRVACCISLFFIAFAAGGTYTFAQSMEICTGTSASTIVYTTDLAGVAAQMTTPAPGTTLAGSSATFTWSAGVGAQQYWIWVGTTPGGMTTSGGPVYVRLFTVLNGARQWNDYGYRTNSQPPVVTALTFSPVEGTYSSLETVTLSTTTPGASINYTTDGSTPTSTHGTPSNGPISVSSTTTINAIAYESGMTPPRSPRRLSRSTWLVSRARLLPCPPVSTGQLWLLCERRGGLPATTGGGVGERSCQ